MTFDPVVPAVDIQAGKIARERIDRLTKPPGSLGRIEELAVRLAQIAGALPSTNYERRGILIGAADHGVTQEGVSAYPSDVTVQMLAGFLGGTAAINAFARTVRANVFVANFGVARAVEDAPRLFNVPVARGTRNLAREPAILPGQVDTALQTGSNVFEELHRTAPLEVFACGEMGIGNTTSAAALICALTGEAPQDIVGRGTGVDNETFARKLAAVEAGVARCVHDDWHQCAQQVGGFEILGLAGAMIAAAQARLPIVLDGFIVSAAALLACRIAPEILGYYIASHASRELGHARALRHLQLVPLFDLDLRLGEATGAALALPFIEAAARMIREMKTFSEAGVSTATAL